MKIIKSLLITLLLFVSTAYGQKTVQGNAVEIIDGQTFVLEDSNKSRYKVQLQYVEVPLDSAFSATVKSHLNKLILNKSIEFTFKFADKDKNFGKIVVDKIDISQQLLRDGAACFLQTNSQDSFEKSEYQKAESLAKEEKRGVWGNVKLIESVEFQKQKAERESLYNEKITDPNRRIFAGFSPNQKMSDKANKDLYIGMTMDEFIGVCGSPPEMPTLFSSEDYQSVTLRIPKTKENVAKGCSGSFSFSRTSKKPAFKMTSALQDLE